MRGRVLSRSPERGSALLVTLLALVMVDALLLALLLWSRAEAREAGASLAASRAAWGAVAGAQEARRWLAAHPGGRGADTVLGPLSLVGGARATVWLTPWAGELLEVRAEGVTGPDSAPEARRARCRWLWLGPPDSAGERRYEGWSGASGAC